MRKIINQSLETVKIRHAREEASQPSVEREIVLRRFPSARVQVLGTSKRLVRDRENCDPVGVVPYIFISSEAHQSDECWKEAADKLLRDKAQLQTIMDSYCGLADVNSSAN